MKLELVPLDSSDEKRAWSMLTRHLIQSTLHNELVREILTRRDHLETAAPEKLLELRAEIKALRFLLGLIHRHDPLPTP